MVKDKYLKENYVVVAKKTTGKRKSSKVIFEGKGSKASEFARKSSTDKKYRNYDEIGVIPKTVYLKSKL